MNDIDEILEQHTTINTLTIEHDHNTKHKITQHPGIKLLHMNIRSLKKNFDEFLATLQSIGNNEIDIIILTEAFINDEHSNEENIPSYNNEKAAGHITRNEGVIIYYKNNMEAIRIEHKLTDCTALLLKLTDKKLNSLTVLGIYRTPSIANSEPFIQSLENQLEEMKINIIAGDININIKNEMDSRVELYLNTMSCYGFSSCINDYTRITESTRSCIDHIFVQENIYDEKIVGLNVKIAVTDHFLQIINIPHRKVDLNHTNEPAARTIIDYTALNKKLETESWENVKRELDPNVSYENFMQSLQEHIEENSTVKQIKRSCKSTPLKPWITKEIIEAIRYRDKLHILSKKRRNDTFLINYVKRYKNYVKSLLRHKKKSYFEIKLKEAGKNLRKTWNTINEITNSRNNKNRNNIVWIEKNGEKITVEQGAEKIANIFNNHFINTGVQLAEKIKTKKEEMQEMLKRVPLNEHTIFMTPTCSLEIQNIINTLKNNNSSGIDLIKIKTLKEIAKYIAEPLAHIINRTISTGIFPEVLKRAVVTPCFKNGSKNDVNNYRPISIISNISKIFEKIINSRIQNFLSNHDIISSNQYGFAKNKSTSDAIYSLKEDIDRAKENKQHCLCILLDLKKAFETIPHTILLDKLNKLGIRGTALALINNYLTNRKQLTKLNSATFSKEETLTNFGLPTGTCLAPLLFNIFLNDLLNLNTHGKISSFADDTRIFLVNSDRKLLYKEANEDFIKLKKWLQINTLTLNLQKTNYIEFNEPIAKEISDTTIIKDIKKVQSAKYLGVTIDSQMKWEQHIIGLVKKLRKTMYKFLQLRQILDIKLLTNTYYALAQSNLNYGVIAWGGATQNIVEKVNVTQRKILKIIHRKPHTYSTHELYQLAQVPTVRQLYITEAVIQTYKNRQNIPQVSHDHNTRYITTQPLQIALTRSTYIQKQAKHVGLTNYNRLPSEIKTIPRLHIFRKHIKPYIMTFT